MINCLTNAELSAKLETDGYVVIQICSPYQIENIRKLYETVPADAESLFWSSSFLEDTEFKTELSEDIGQILNHCVSKLLVGHKSLGSSFLTKFPGKDSIMPIHQDWTVVDETKFGSYTIWMPLTDTDPNNGALQVIAGSHKLNAQLRSPSLPVAFEPIRGQLRPYLQSVNLKVGEAILFNHALMHASPPNLSNTPRVAVTFGFVPKEVSLCMYYNKDGNVQKYKMPQDMFIKYPQIRNEPQIGELEKEF
ncbi:MAG: phytanoyl-CoA dioxygenase family protein, partial [Flavobacteriales bacterium]|nr:phytanoyl-CoA dioxygenase family protein [Flavobacteriales bacterium]